MDGGSISMDPARPEMTEAGESSEEKAVQWPNWSWSPSQARPHPQRPFQKCSWGPFQTPQASNWPWSLRLAGSVGYNPRIRMSWGSLGPYSAGKPEASEGKFASGKVIKSKRRKISPSKRRALRRKRLLLSSLGESVHTADISFSTTNSVSIGSNSPVRSSSRASTNRWSRSPSPIDFHEDVLVPNTNRSRSLSPTVVPVVSLTNKSKSSPPIFMRLASLSGSKLINNVKPRSQSVLDIFLQSLPDSHDFRSEIPEKNIRQPLDRHVRTLKPPQRKIILNRSPLHLSDTAQPCDLDNCKSSFDEVSAACEDNSSNQHNEGTILTDKTQENVSSSDKNSEESSDQITCLINSDGESDMKDEQQLSFKSNIASSELATPPIMDSARQWNFSPVPLPSLSDDSLPWNPLPLPFITPLGSFSDSQMGAVESSQVAHDGQPFGNSTSTPSSKRVTLEMEDVLSNKKKCDTPDSQHENILQFDTENSESSVTEMTPQFDRRLHSSSTFEENPLVDENSLVPVKTADFSVLGSTFNQNQSSNNISVEVDKQPVSSESDSQSSNINVCFDNQHLTERMLIQESENSQLNLSSPEEFNGEEPISPHSEKAVHSSENQPERKLLSEILSHSNMSSFNTEHKPLSQSESKCASTDDESNLVTHSACTTILPVSSCLSSPKSSLPYDSSNAHVDINEPMLQNVDVVSKSPSQPSENRNTEAKSSPLESKDGPSRSPSPSSEESCTRSRSPSPSSEGSDARSRSPSPSSQRSSSRSRSPSQSSERSDSRSRSSSPSTDESDDWSRSSSPSSERVDVRSRSPSPSSQRSYARSKSPSPSTDGIDTQSRSPFSSPERSFTTSVRQAIESISFPPQNIQSDLEPANKEMAVNNEQAEPLPLEKSFSTNCQLSWIPLPEGSPSPCNKLVSFCQTTSTLQDEDEKSMSADRLEEDEVMEHENFSHIPDKAPHSLNDDQILEQDISSKNVDLAKSPLVERTSSPVDEPVRSNIESSRFTMPGNSVISNYSSLTPGDLLTEDISRSPPNSPQDNDDTEHEDMLLSHDSTAVSLELSKNRTADLDLSTEATLPTAARSENLVESEEPQYPFQANQKSNIEKRTSLGTALVTLCPVEEKSPDPVSEKSEFLPSNDSNYSNLGLNESETNNVSSETVTYKTEVANRNSSVLDAPMNLSKGTSENSRLVSEKIPNTEGLAPKSDNLSDTDNDSETKTSAIHTASHFQGEVLDAKEKQDIGSDKAEEFINVAENSPSDSCKVNNTSDMAEYSPAPSLYSSLENSPISMCNSPPSPSSDEDMNTSEDSLPFTFRPGRNYDSNEVDTEADLKISNEPQETDTTPGMEQDINKVNRKGLKRARSPSPVALNRDISSAATDSHNSSDESEDQVLNCQKRLKISSSGGRLVMNKQACKLFAAQDSKKQVLKRQKSVRGMLIELYESSGHRGIFTPKLYHQKRRLRTITTRSLVKKLKRRTPNHDLKYITQKRMDLIKAVEEGNMPKIQELIQDMGPAVREERTGSTLLHVAVAHNQVDAVLFLLRLISPNVVNSEGETPAHLAAFMGHTQILRILLTDEELCYEKKNRQGRTYTNLLSAPLCDAVLGKDRNKAQELLRLGADPDYDVGDVVKGQLPSDVTVSTPRQLATDLGLQDILHIFPKKKSGISKKMKEPDVVFTSNSVISKSDEGKHYPDPVEIEVTSAQEAPEGDVYQVNTEPRGFVCILDYNTFRDRQDLDLEGSMQDVSNLASIFSKMGYAGEVYSSPTTDETTEILQNVREKDILKEVGCLIVVVNSHGVGEDRFLTSDLKSLDISRTCGLFKDSDCPHMVNKPKIFLFNTGSGLYRESKKARYSKPLTTRVSEPLKDALCLFSSHSGFASWAYSDKGTPFYLAFCNTLAKHAHSMEISDLFRELLKEYGKSSPATVPELRNIGFSKKFFFNPVPFFNPMP